MRKSKDYLLLRYVLLCFVSLIISCDVIPYSNPKKVVWEVSSINSNAKGEFHKEEHFSVQGSLIYDSTAFYGDTGYKVQYYDENRVVASDSYYEPNLHILEQHQYDGHGNPLKSLIIQADDTVEWAHLNQYDSNELLLGIVSSAKGMSSASKYAEFTQYLDNVVLERYFDIVKGDSTLFKTIEYMYDEESRLHSSVVSDLYQNLKDSLTINYNERSRTTYRSLRGSVYGIINVETYSEDSLSIRSKDLRVDQDIILKKKVLERW